MSKEKYNQIIDDAYKNFLMTNHYQEHETNPAHKKWIFSKNGLLHF
jgi:hypothetical protein